MNIDQLAANCALHAEVAARANDLGPREVIGALLTAGIATAFTNMEDETDMHEMASCLVRFVNAECTNLIEGIENAEEAASNG